MKVREVITYKHYFEEFFAAQNQKVRDKIIKILSIIETIERVPVQYLRFIEGTNGLFEVRVQLGSNILEFFVSLTAINLLYYYQAFKRKRKRHHPVKLSEQLN